MGLGCVVRDDRGGFIRARSTVVRGSFMPREAEALGLKEAMSWIKNWRVRKCIFKSDSKVLVDAVNGNHGQSLFDTLAEDCNELLKHFEEVSVVFTHRSANIVAHLVARASYYVSDLQEWHHIALDFIACNLALETL